ncbi:MAG: DMT family transporter [bacterium]|nr:DMT family transporter [bacterium]
MHARARGPSGEARPTALPYLILGGAQLAVGAAGIFARLALTGAGALAVSASRLSIAALLLAVTAMLRGMPERPKRGERVVLGAAGLALALHFAAWIASLQYVGIAVSTLLVATAPIWTSLYDAVVHRRMPNRAQAGAFAAGAFGLAMVVGFARVTPPVPGHELLGAGLALLGGAAIGAYFLLVRTVRGRLGTRTIVTHTYGAGAIALVAAAALAHQPPPPPGDLSAWGGILAMALVSQLVGHTAMNLSLRWFSPSAVAFATLLEPVAAALLAWVLFGERLTPLAILGGAILLAAIAVMLREERGQSLE